MKVKGFPGGHVESWQEFEAVDHQYRSVGESIIIDTIDGIEWNAIDEECDVLFSNTDRSVVVAWIIEELGRRLQTKESSDA